MTPPQRNIEEWATWQLLARSDRGIASPFTPDRRFATLFPITYWHAVRLAQKSPEKQKSEIEFDEKSPEK